MKFKSFCSRCGNNNPDSSAKECCKEHSHSYLEIYTEDMSEEVYRKVEDGGVFEDLVEEDGEIFYSRDYCYKIGDKYVCTNLGLFVINDDTKKLTHFLGMYECTGYEILDKNKGILYGNYDRIIFDTHDLKEI